MPGERTCSECGAEIHSDAPGLCTRCLLMLGLKAGADAASSPVPSEIGNNGNLKSGAQQPADHSTLEALFDRRWAITLLDQAMDHLRADYATSNKSQLFAALKGHLSGAERLVPYGELGASLGMSEGAVKKAVYDLRKRYGQLLRAEIAATVSNPAEVEEEIRNLISAMAR